MNFGVAVKADANGEMSRSRGIEAARRHGSALRRHRE
jgi:hypothetical protein